MNLHILLLLLAGILEFHKTESFSPIRRGSLQLSRPPPSQYTGKIRLSPETPSDRYATLSALLPQRERKGGDAVKVTGLAMEMSRKRGLLASLKLYREKVTNWHELVLYRILEDVIGDEWSEWTMKTFGRSLLLPLVGRVYLKVAKR